MTKEELSPSVRDFSTLAPNKKMNEESDFGAVLVSLSVFLHSCAND